MPRPKLTVVEVQFERPPHHDIPAILNDTRRDWAAIADEEAGLLILRFKAPASLTGAAFRIPLGRCLYYRCSGAKASDEPDVPVASKPTP